MGWGRDEEEAAFGVRAACSACDSKLSLRISRALSGGDMAGAAPERRERAMEGREMFLSVGGEAGRALAPVAGDRGGTAVEVEGTGPPRSARATLRALIRPMRLRLA
jgi:hypothetical protein